MQIHQRFRSARRGAAVLIAVVLMNAGCTTPLGWLHGRASEPSSPGDPVAALEAARREAEAATLPRANDGRPLAAATTPVVGRALAPLTPDDGQDATSAPLNSAPLESASLNAQPVAAASPPPPPAPTRSVLYAVHLASYRQDSEVSAGWRSLRARAGSALADLAPRVEAADLGAQGVYKRLKAGPLPNPSAARERCGALRALGLYCELTDFHGQGLSG